MKIQDICVRNVLEVPGKRILRGLFPARFSYFGIRFSTPVSIIAGKRISDLSHGANRKSLDKTGLRMMIVE